MNIKKLCYLAFFILSICFLDTACSNQDKHYTTHPALKTIDLSAFSSEPLPKKLNLLFIHHSCGASLLAAKGDKLGQYCLYTSHPNGGGLRRLLQQNNYTVHEATYNSKIGQDTNINHWHSKFRDHMDRILKTKLQDSLLPGNSVNSIIVFKSCYPANNITSEGRLPGDPSSPEKTIANYKASYNSLLPLFKHYPKTLFVAMTAPPLAKPKMNMLKEFFKNIKAEGPQAIGRRARRFNNWLKDTEKGWLKSYDLKNVVVFDYYDILTGKGQSNWTKYPTKNGQNSHPSSEGNTIAAKEFILFINKAVRYSGLI